MPLYKLINPPAAALVVLFAITGCSQDPTTESESAQMPEEVVPLELPPEDGNGLNLLFLTIDTLRPDHLGAYGYGPPTSPAIDALAGEGALFERAFSPRGLTWPALGTLMTSRYPVEHGVRKNGIMMSESQATLAEILQAKGYECAALVSRNVLDQNWEGFEEKLWFKDSEAALYAGEWLKEPRDHPFFLWVHFFGPHKPYTAPEEYEKRFSPNYTGPFKGDVPYTDAITLHQKELEQDDLDHLIALYDALIARSDDLVRHILEMLESLGLADNTLVVFASDHGEDLYEHNKYFYHLTSVYDSVLHVPLVFRLPGVIPEGLRIDTMVEMMDIAPTVLELLGFSPAPAFHGTTLAPLFRGESLELGPAYSEWEDQILTLRTDRYRYILNPTGHKPIWLGLDQYVELQKETSYQRILESGEMDILVKQFRYPIDEIELYDLDRDPLVMVDDLDGYAADVTKLNRMLLNWQKASGWKFSGGFEEDIDPEVQETLEALGYVF